MKEHLHFWCIYFTIYHGLSYSSSGQTFAARSSANPNPTFNLGTWTIVVQHKLSSFIFWPWKCLKNSKWINFRGPISRYQCSSQFLFVPSTSKTLGSLSSKSISSYNYCSQALWCLFLITVMFKIKEPTFDMPFL